MRFVHLFSRLFSYPLLHPFLFAMFPVLFLFGYNIVEIVPIDLLFPMLIVIVGTLVLLLLLRLFTKNYKKIALVASLLIVLFFSYGHARNLLFSGGVAELNLGFFHLGIQFALGLLWVFLLAAGVLLIIRTHRSLIIPTRFLNVVAVTLAIISLVTISVYAIGKPTYTPQEVNGEATDWDSGNPDNLPDIYYIILDTYARQDTLEEVFGYDNSEFANYLTSTGFYIAIGSLSNYDYTAHSLASSLDMTYLTGEESRLTLFGMIGNSKVSRLLGDQGYRFVFVSGGTEVIAGNIAGYTDMCLMYKSGSIFRMSGFMDMLIHTTILSPLAWHFKDFLGSEDRKERLYAFDQLANIPLIEEPTFTYAHIMLPHPPYLFDQNGNPVKPGLYDLVNIWQPSQHGGRYIDQLVFTNQKVKTLIEKIMSRSDIAPIIIIQGDHGVWWEKEKAFEILNAYYLPGKDNQLLHETISPVNSFRVVFNLYFGADYELLEDKSYTTGSWDQPE